MLDQIRCFALDMDGTFYLGDKLLPGAVEFLARLGETGRRFVFLTNNSSKSGADYQKKLAGLGVNVSLDQIITSGQAAIYALKKYYPGKSVYLLGNDSLKEEFCKEGITLEESHPDMVVTAFDLGLNYARWTQICDFVRAGLPYLATHPDYNCPTETGFVPDIGATHAFIHASTGRWPDRIAGKPHRDIVDYTLARTGVAAAETTMVGDRLYTDVATGVNHGLTGIRVLSGETKLADLEHSDVQPHLIFDGLGDMIPYLG
jgi:HAD superfamily hydrolase (TIGR01450 family)